MVTMKALLKMELIFTKRNIATFVWGCAMPLIFFILFSSLQDYPSKEVEERVVREMLISMTAFSSISFAFFTLPFSLIEDKDNGWLNIINQSPISKLHYFMARFVRIIINYIFAIIIIFSVGYFVKGVDMSFEHWLKSFVLLTFGSCSFLAIGLLLSLIKSSQTLSIVGNISYIILAILGGLWFPAYLFPSWLQTISKITPTFHLVNMINSTLENPNFTNNDISSTVSAVVLIIYFLSFTALTLFINKKIEQK